MCLLVFSYKQHPVYDLIFATNRDEFYERSTRAARFWDEEQGVLAGKDLKGGGTWLGITKEGKFSALTNYRDPSIEKKNAPSRGHLVLDFLVGDANTDQYLQDVDERADNYNGFNLLTGDLSELTMMYYSNQEQKIRDLDAGLYGLSNKLLDTPWPKVKKAKNKLADIIDSPDISEQELFNLLKDHDRAPDDQLPDTGIPKELERAVSPIFIKTENYGTRNSTIILVDKSGNVTFEERRYQGGTQIVDEKNKYQFQIEME